MTEQPNEKILQLLQEKIVLKQDVFEQTKTVFRQLKNMLSELQVAFKRSVKVLGKEVIIEFNDKGEYEAEFTLADETLVFVMHSNIFTFDSTHDIWKTKYVKDDSKRAYCGKIFIYNFLSDSFQFNRVNDKGYLIARIFINKEGHYFVEGKKQLGYLYTDFPTTILDEDNLRKILDSAILYCLDFDPFTPPFESIAEVTVKDVVEAGLQSNIITGKRLGFSFQSDRKDLID